MLENKMAEATFPTNSSFICALQNDDDDEISEFDDLLFSLEIMVIKRERTAK